MLEVRVQGVSVLIEIEGTFHILVFTSLCMASNWLVWGVGGFSEFLRAYTCVISEIRYWSIPCLSFQIHYSLIQPFDIHSGTSTASIVEIRQQVCTLERLAHLYCTALHGVPCWKTAGVYLRKAGTLVLYGTAQCPLLEDSRCVP